MYETLIMKERIGSRHWSNDQKSIEEALIKACMKHWFMKERIGSRHWSNDQKVLKKHWFKACMKHWFRKRE